MPIDRTSSCTAFNTSDANRTIKRNALRLPSPFVEVRAPWSDDTDCGQANVCLGHARIKLYIVNFESVFKENDARPGAALEFK